MKRSILCRLLIWSSSGLLLIGCGDKPVEEKPVARPVKMIEIGGAGGSGTRELPGTIKAAQHAEMSFQVSGRITKFLVREGQDVNKGEALARLDDADYRADLDKSKANFRKAQADLERGMSVYRQDPGAISKTAIDSYQRAVDVAEAQLRKEQKAVDDTILRAPFGGLVARRLVEDFQNVKAKEPVLILQDLSHLEVEVAVPERDMAKAKATENISNKEITRRARPRVIVTSRPDHEFPAVIKEFATTADEVTRTFQVRLMFETPTDVKILPGMTAKVRYQTLSSAAVMLPTHAVFSDDQGRPSVWRVDPETMTVGRHSVSVGSMSGDQINVTGGLSVGDLVAVSGMSQLREGLTVRRYGK